VISEGGRRRAGLRRRRRRSTAIVAMRLGPPYQRMGPLNTLAPNAHQRLMQDSASKFYSQPQIVGLDMTSKIKFAIGGAIGTGLLIILVPGFAHEIAAGVVPSSKLQPEVEGNVTPPDPLCAHAPWPFGCEWGAPIGRKKTVRKSHGHGHHPNTAMRQGQVQLAGKL